MIRVVAVDGPSGVGKSTVSKQLAGLLNWTYLDTGAMYRTVTLAWLRDGAKGEGYRDPEWLAGLDMDFQGERIILSGADVATEIRSQAVTDNASTVSAEPAVRKRLTRMQREIGSRRPCILDGRDIGTVVFPDSFFKVFLTASSQVRARRRWLELGGKGSGLTLEKVQADLDERDRKDSTRDLAPLKAAEDAFLLDTENLTEQQVVDILYREARERLRRAE